MKSKIALAYRIPMTVNQVVVFANNSSYPLCPHCHCTIEREYQNYCDRCGQALGWQTFSRATIILK